MASEKIEKKQMEVCGITDKLTAQAALLDFYSDRAVAHASFLVASIFGLVTLLAIVQQMVNQTQIQIDLICFSLMPFYAFSYVGFWTLQRFGKYAAVADKMHENFIKYSEFKVDTRGKKEDFSAYENKLLDRTKQQLVVKRILGKSTRGEFLLFYSAYLLLVSVLSYVVYFQSGYIIVRLCWVATMVVLILLIYIPIFYSIKRKKEV